MRTMKTYLAAFLFSALSLGSVSAEKPNIIFILSDDLAQGDLGCYRQKIIQTPRIDQMAQEGTRFMQAYCGTSVCAPSRTSLMTGLHSGHAPVRGNWEIAKGAGTIFASGDKGAEESRKVGTESWLRNALNE
jgi:arylsulfatase A-like enzyme